MSSFRERLTFEDRLAERQRANARRPEHVATIIERGSPHAPSLDREKFLLPRELNGSQLIYIIRRRLSMNPSEALFLVCGRQMVTAADTVRGLYAKHCQEDGFLYITYTLENTFGHKEEELWGESQ